MIVFMITVARDDKTRSTKVATTSTIVFQIITRMKFNCYFQIIYEIAVAVFRGGGVEAIFITVTVSWSFIINTVVVNNSSERF